ncbi:MAG: DUF1080 domain-containing protein [Gemmatimonadetes bacterium]|nr:DUF1080 domain-containing protein [Gemmatimonadota bacterium]MYD25701.1 DUF1080 domain-containing protein [Gemmatimonadota bacterium]MYI99003.1 DUF1080 domain-containing protein [Gemmatimonadota bacterium]
MADSIGYTDTSVIPGSKWRVHDGDRPQPRVVTPGGACGSPPSDAVVLFDGSDLAQWVGRDGGDAAWKVESGYMEVNGTGDISTRAHFGDCQLHLEWATPEEVVGDSQGRGNSGVFLLGLYEIQVLDSFDNRTYADGSASSIYGQYPPLVNASRGPGEWQSYDIVFESPSWDGDRLVNGAHLTVIHNGIVVHHRQRAVGPTGHRDLANYDTPHADTGPLQLQDHGDPVRFRNIWMRRLTAYDAS